MASTPQVRLSWSLSTSVHHLVTVTLATFAWVMLASPASAQKIAGGVAHTVVTTPDGNVWTWGSNSSSRLGLGSGAGSDRKVPTQIPTISNIVAVAAGGDFSLALDATGAVWAWGANGFGQLGTGDNNTRHVPTILGLTNIVAIAAGMGHSAALDSTGQVYTWGWNGNGQLGNGTTTNANTPILLTTPTAVSAIAVGAYHTLAVKTNGTVFGWGWQIHGQLGTGSTSPTNQTTPAQMSGITTATAVAGGTYHSLVLLSDGTLKATGQNGAGQLGVTGTTRTSPVDVTSVAGVTAIRAGEYHSVIRKSDETVRVFGNGDQLGTGGGSDSSTPVTPTGVPSTIEFIAAGKDHSFAVTDDGVVWAWGTNSSGQLGDGTPHERLTPVTISDLAYDWRVGTPWFTPSGTSPTSSSNVTVTVNEETPGATVHYTLNGDDPTPSDPTIAAGGTIVIDRVRTLKAKAYKTGMPDSHIGSGVYTLRVPQPTITPILSGAQTSPVTVTLGFSSSAPGATIHYTLDGTTPTTASPVYTAPFVVSTKTTVTAIGVKADWVSSSLINRQYTFNYGTLAPPTMTPAPGHHTSTVTVELAAMPGATIRYVTGSATLSTSSPIYNPSAPITLTSSTTVKALAMHDDYVTSSHATGAFTILVAAPVFTPIGGTYVPGQTITVTSDTPGATIRYTLDGREPTASDAVIASGASLVAGNFTLKASASKTGATTSTTTTATYAVSGTVAAATVAAGSTNSFAVRPDGTVWGWGSNSLGGLGNGTNEHPQRFPTQVRGLTGATAVKASSSHTIAQRLTAQAVTWGSNAQGQLGNGTSGGSSLLFGAVGSLSQVVAVTAGSSHMLALTSDGTVWAWGTNTQRQLGDGSNINRHAPVAVQTVTNAIAIAAGYQFSAALKSDGTVWTWGANDYGQLGDGTNAARTTVAAVPGVTDIIAIAAGHYHLLALKSDGTLVAWGRNGSGQLGRSTTNSWSGVGAVHSLTSVQRIAAGATHSLALLSDGTVWAFGSNPDGELGIGTTVTSSNVPTQAVGLADVVRIDAGGSHSIALTSDLTVWTWGSNDFGQLGDGKTSTTGTRVPTPMSGPDMMWRVATPTLDVDPGQYFNIQNVMVSCVDPDAVLHYTTNGVEPTESDPVVVSGGTVSVPESLTLKVKGWKTGTLPSLTATATYELKVVMPVVTPASGTYATAQSVSIASTTSGVTIRYTTDGTDPGVTSPVYSGAFTADGPLTVRARAYKTNWTTSEGGYATYAITGPPVDTPAIAPAAGSYGGPQLVTITTVAAGATIRYTLDGSTPTASSAVFTVPLLLDTTTTVMARAFKPGCAPSATALATYALDPAGQVGTPTIAPAGGRFTTQQTVTVTGPVGATLHYTLNGVDPTESDPTITSGGTLVVDRSLPLKVKAWQSGSTPSAVRRADFLITGALSIASQFSMALKSDRTLWTWGEYTYALGDNVTTRYVPGQIATNVVGISAGSTHGLFVKADGSVWVWGSAGAKLGTGNGTPERTAVALPTIANVIAVSAGSSHSLALKADGTVWAWGTNTYGQVGDGTPTTRNTPVPVVGLSGVRAVAAGGNFSLALADDGGAGGSVWAWGHNWEGQLGDGTNVDRLYPVRVTLPTPIVAIAAGDAHAIALAADGTVWTWGRNTDGQLGDDTKTSPRIPSRARSLTGVQAIAAGEARSHAVRGDGQVWSWGTIGDASGIPESLDLYNWATVPYRAEEWPALLLLDGGSIATLFARIDGAVWGAGINSLGVLGTGSAASGDHEPVAASGLVLADNTWLLTDSDGDSIPTWRELLNGLDPLSADSDGDGLPDGPELASSQPGADPDADGDGVPNAVEVTRGTDPFSIDTDADGVNDRLDAFPLDPTRTTAPPPTPGDTTPPIITLIEPTNAIPIPP